MVLGKKGVVQAIVLIMVAIMAFIVLAVLTGPLITEVNQATNQTYLNTSDPNISTTHRATVIILDMGLFYFLSTLVAVSLAYVSGKRNITGVLSAIFIFIIVIVLITPLKDLVVLARDSTHLNCGATGLTVGVNLTCIFVDLWLFYFVATVVASAITFIFLTRVLPKIKDE